MPRQQQTVTVQLARLTDAVDAMRENINDMQTSLRVIPESYISRREFASLDQRTGVLENWRTAEVADRLTGQNKQSVQMNASLLVVVGFIFTIISSILAVLFAHLLK